MKHTQRFTLVFLILTSFLFTSGKAFAKKITVKSPDKNITVNINISNQISFSINYNDQPVLKEGVVSLQLAGEVLGKEPKLKKTGTSQTDETVTPVVPLKNSTLKNRYNALTLFFDNNYQLEFRVFNNGVAYRFVTDKEGDITVVNEQADFTFADNYKAFLSKTEYSFSSYEHVFKPVWLQDFNNDDLAIIPLFLNAGPARVLIAEADLYDYPAIFMQGKNGNTLSGWFPKYPLKTEPITGTWQADRRLNITKEADYIAKTKGSRSFPWRVFAIGKDDSDIVTNNLVYLLSRPSEETDFGWIKPGQAAWEWWHASNITGVDFKSGYNNETYKYYIDFASTYNVRYIVMDEGWSKSVLEITKPNPDIDLQELVRYAKERDVALILWASWLAVENTPGFFEYLNKLGIAGVKIDFMDRSDQWMINFYERTAQRALKNKLLVDFHGSITPRGLRRAYPNVISYEGLTGMEQNKVGGFDLPENHVILPFTRNVVGPMDYTPGAMRSVHPKYWHANWANPMSIGTRAHQMALFVVFESGLQMLADNPSNYYKEKECTEFITGVPTTWDETRVLSGKIGEYIIVAKRKGSNWFIGGITNSKNREIEVSLSFLKKGTPYTITMFSDGINAGKNAIDYKESTKTVKNDDNLLINMVMNGGFAAKLTEQ